MSDKSEKDKCLDKIFWFKLAVSLFAGVLYGGFEVTGFLSFVIYFVASSILSFVYFKRFINPDEDIDYQSEIFVEGLNVCVPLFILSWTAIYTIMKVNSINSVESSTIS